MGQIFNADEVTARQITIDVAGQPKKGPDFVIPKGFAVAIINSPTNVGSPIVFVGKNAAEVVDPAKRAALSKGAGVVFQLGNPNQIAVDADTNGTKVDFIFESSAG